MAEKKQRRHKLGHALRVSDSYKRFVLDQLEELGDVRPRSMFGGVGLYHRDVFFGIVAADVLYLKVDDTTRGDYERAGMGPFRPFPERGGGMKVLRRAARRARKRRGAGAVGEARGRRCEAGGTLSATRVAPSEATRDQGNRTGRSSRSALDLLRRAVPAHQMARPQRGVGDLRRPRRLMADADVGVRRLAAADAVEPVLQVRQRPVTARSDVDVGFRRMCPWRVRRRRRGRRPGASGRS